MSTIAFPHVFRPLQLRHRRLKSRLTFGAHTANMAEDGLPRERHRAYYEERARGGAAMIVTEPMPVHPAAVLTARNFRPCDDAVIPHFRRITEAGHDVTVVTRHPTLGAELARTAADTPLRARLRQLGVTEIGDSAITQWYGDAAVVTNLLDHGTVRIEADTLVTATVNESRRWLADDLADGDAVVHCIGDCVAPRLAVMAILEGRELAQRL